MANYEPNFIPSRPEAHHDYVVYRDVRIPMRDGVELSANIFFPAKDGVVDFSRKYPVLINRTGYMGINGELFTTPVSMAYYANEQGYVFVINASRGTYRSEGGAMRPIMDDGWGENRDGVDTVNWIAQQPWSNGKVATCGGSWMGNTQYAIWLAEDVPALITSAIQVPAMNSIDGGWVYKDEFLDMGAWQLWTIMNVADQVKTKHLPEDVCAAILKDNEEMGNPIFDLGANLALDHAQLQAEYGLANTPILRHVPFYQEWLKNRDNPAYFQYNDTRTRKHDAKRPVLFVSSWYDLFADNAINGYRKMVEDAPTEEVAKGHRLIIGTWPHVASPLYRQYPGVQTDSRMMVMEWTKQQIDGIPSKFFAENPVSIFVQGVNRWRSEQTWPLADAETKRFYLHSLYPANTFFGGGYLSEEVPAGSENPDQYMADPNNPIRTGGGHSLSGGQADQRVAEMRPDVLCYTSAELTEDMEVTGYVKATLYAATSATDTDFIVKLIDVCSDGICYNVLTGGRRGRYVKNGRANPTALTPGEIVKYEINLHATSYVFRKGHKIRVEVCSSDAKNFDVNPNAFVDLNTATKADYVVAAQTVYHDAEHPTVIELPVIPANRERKWIDKWPFDAKQTGYTEMMPFESSKPAFRNGPDLPSTTSQEKSCNSELYENSNSIRF